MFINKYNDCILSVNDIIMALYSGKIKNFSNVYIDDPQELSKFNASIDINSDEILKLKNYVEPSISKEEINRIRQNTWFIPENYKNFDISSWLLQQTNNQIEKDRIQHELELFEKNNMLDMLILLKYLVDFMRENNIVWGIGRGSSVSSYCLYLIGVHKIDSIKYNLDIREFLKGEDND